MTNEELKALSEDNARAITATSEGANGRVKNLKEVAQQ